MNILNRYILKKFFRPFIYSFAILCILITVSQVFEELDRLLGKGISLTYVGGYILSLLPIQAIQVLPVACLLGTLFVVGNLSRHREYIAGLAGGLPPEKFLGGLLLAGIFISFAGLFANETIVPAATRYSKIVYREKIRHLGTFQQTVYDNLVVSGKDGRLWWTAQLNESSNHLGRVIVDTYRDARLLSQIDAKKADWTREKGWLFSDGAERTFLKEGMEIDTMIPFKEKAFAFEEKPSDLITQEPQSEEMNYKTLHDHIRRLRRLGVQVRRLEVDLMVKLAFPFSCFVVIALGIPLALKGKGNKAVGLAAGGALSLGYMGFMQLGNALAIRFVPPVVGAWLGNIVFLGIAAGLWIRMRKTA